MFLFKIHIKVLTYQYSSLSIWFISFSIVFSRFICIVTNSRIFSFFYDWKILHYIFFIQSFIDGHLDYFCVLAIVANMRVHIFFPVSVFLSFGYIPRSRIVGSYASSIFNLLRNTHAVLHSGFNNLHPHQPCTRTLFSPYPCQHLLSLIF